MRVKSFESLQKSLFSPLLQFTRSFVNSEMHEKNNSLSSVPYRLLREHHNLYFSELNRVNRYPFVLLLSAMTEILQASADINPHLKRVRCR